MQVMNCQETELKNDQADTRLDAEDLTHIKARNIVLENGNIASLVQNVSGAVISAYILMNITFR